MLISVSSNLPHAVVQAGFVHQQSMQYHWKNEKPQGEEEQSVSSIPLTRQPYASFEQYLAPFRSKRRMQIRRERFIVSQSGLKIRVLTGEQVMNISRL